MIISNVILTVLEKIKRNWSELSSIVTQCLHSQSCLHYLGFKGCHWILECVMDSSSF
jgi:hypothetical protein